MPKPAALSALMELMELTVPGLGVIRLRPLDPETDSATLHDWLRRDYAAFWGMQRLTADQVRDKFRAVVQEGRMEALIGELHDGVGGPRRLFLMEAYRPRQDDLARFYPAQDSDRGFHLIVAPAGGAAVPGLSFHIMRLMCGWIFRDASVQRIVAEPDIRNARMLERCLQTGFRLGRVMHLPHKTAQLVTLARADFERLGETPPPKATLPAGRGRWVKLHLLAGRIGRKLGIYERNW
ncbi:GNAT family N-acetyltransferase [Sphaerotilus natans]|uniref:GNAT family N-acetyltransferase n=1 Tax=Sphaerotilus natans TaxID=34103 RepID=UPI00158C0C26|nr:GNAT family N-acetyltransferase [Sphaerotilus natans]